MRRTLVLAITVIVTGGSATAHVAPSVDDNNRYLKLTPQADRVRLAYTVFFGEVPGLRTRPGLDTDRNGTISDAEADAFAGKLALDVAAALELTVDGVHTPVVWNDVIVGLGSPSVRAGSFSIDMVVSLCLSRVGGHHELRLRDRFRIPRPGETEVRIEDGPGIAIRTARVGAANDPGRNYRFVGPGGPLSDDGLELVFDAGDDAPVDGTCGERPTRPMMAWLVGGAVLAVALAAGGVAARRRRRVRRSAAGAT